MAIKNFRADIDIKPAKGTVEEQAPVFERAEIRTMAKDLELVRSHMAGTQSSVAKGKARKRAEPKVIAEEGPKTILSEGLFKKSAVTKPEIEAMPEPVKMLKSSKRVDEPQPKLKIKKSMDANLNPQPPAYHISFLHILLESFITLIFFMILLGAAGYYWLVIRDTETLLTQIPIQVLQRRPPEIQAPTPVAVVSEPTPDVGPTVVEAPVGAPAPLLLTPSMAMSLADFTNLDEFAGQLARRAPREAFIAWDQDGISFTDFSAQFGLPSPCAAGTTCEISNYQFFVRPKQQGDKWALLIKMGSGNFANIRANEDFEQSLVVFRAGNLLGISGQVFKESSYQGTPLKFMNFGGDSALDLIYFEEENVLGIATSKADALQLIEAWQQQELLAKDLGI